MSMTSSYPLVSEAALDDLSWRGQNLYETLKAQIEPDYDRQFIAIHVDAGDYAISRTSGDAMRAMRQRHQADGRLYIRKIGSEPEYGLAARILESDMIAALQ